MRLIQGIKELKRQRFKKPVVTMGIFDGVHLAHQKIIKEVVRRAKMLKGTSIVVTFNPHPLRIFGARQKIAPLITSVAHRINLIKNLGVDVLLLLDFNKRFSRIAAENFVRRILVDIMGISYLIVGKTFRFGRGGAGTTSLLKKLGGAFGFRVSEIKPIRIYGKIISSSKIRTLIQEGRITKANAFLGRTFSILGKVRKGSARGRILGYPTANIEPEQEIVPCRGVYAVFVKLDNKIFPGILNIGTRPTFKTKRSSPDTIEVHIFNFRKKIYGQKLEIFFIQRIRAERKFFSQQALLKQIKRDELKAKKILKFRGSFPEFPHA